MSTDSASDSGSPVVHSASPAVAVVVKTFAGPGPRGHVTTDGVGTAAGMLRPGAMCLSGNSLLLIQNTDSLRRIHLPSTPEMRAALSASVASGLLEVSPLLSGIAPLIDVIVSYAGLDGTGDQHPACAAVSQLMISASDAKLELV